MTVALHVPPPALWFATLVGVSKRYVYVCWHSSTLLCLAWHVLLGLRDVFLSFPDWFHCVDLSLFISPVSCWWVTVLRHHWVTVSTPGHRSLCASSEFPRMVILHSLRPRSSFQYRDSDKLCRAQTLPPRNNGTGPVVFLPAISSASVWYLIHREELTLPYGKTDCISGMDESGTGSHPVMTVLGVVIPTHGA